MDRLVLHGCQDIVAPLGEVGGEITWIMALRDKISR